MCVWQVGILTISSLHCTISCERCLQLETQKNKKLLTDSLRVGQQVQNQSLSAQVGVVRSKFCVFQGRGMPSYS